MNPPHFRWIRPPLLLGLGSIVGGLVYQTMTPDGGLIMVLAGFCLLLSPFIFVWRKLSQQVFMALVLLFIPFQIDQTLFLQQDHIGGAQGLVVSALGISVFILLLIEGIEFFEKRRLPYNPFCGTTGFLWIAMAGLSFFSIFVALDRMLALYEWLLILKYGLVMFLIVNWVRKGGSLSFLIFFLLSGLILESCLALLQGVSGGALNLKLLGGRDNIHTQDIGTGEVSRIGGTLGGANALAWYLDALVPLSWAIFLDRNIHGMLRWMGLSGGLLGTIALVMTFSRGGWLAFLMGMAIVLFFMGRRASLTRKVWMVIFSILLLGIFLVIILGVPNPLKSRFTADDNQSAYIRLPLMKVARNMIMAHPFLGVGLNNYTLVHHDYDTTSEHVTLVFPYPVHNLFLQIMAEIGIPGFLFFIALILFPSARALKKISNISGASYAIIAGCIGGITGVLIQGLVENCTLGGYHILPLWVFLALLTVISGNDLTNPSSEAPTLSDVSQQEQS